MANPSIVKKIKTDLRISHSRLDDDVSDNIDSCVADLMLVGIKVSDDNTLDRNIINAIKLWCRARYTHDVEESKLYEMRYSAVKAVLKSSKKYRRANDDKDE